MDGMSEIIPNMLTHLFADTDQFNAKMDTNDLIAEKYDESL